MGEKLDQETRDRIAEGVHDDGTPRDWFSLDIRRADYGTLLQCAERWHCSRENALGVLCRAVRVQVWPLGDVLTNYPEFQSWVERIVQAEQAPLREAFRRATPEEQATMAKVLPRGGRRYYAIEPKPLGTAPTGHRHCSRCNGPLQQFDAGLCRECLIQLRAEEPDDAA